MNISDHAYQRYVERTKGYTLETQVKDYITSNKTLITSRIEQLFESSELFFEGKFRTHEKAEIYVNKHGWVFPFNKKQQRIITIYKVDLGVDEEFNRLYISKMKGKIEELKLIAQGDRQIANNKNAMLEIENNDLLQERKLLQQRIELINREIKQNEEAMRLNNDKAEQSEFELHKKVEQFICKKMY